MAQTDEAATPIGALNDLFDPRFAREMNIGQRIHLAQSRIRYIQKDKPKGAEGAGGKALRYSVTSHDKVTAECRAALHPCGVIYFPVREGAEVKRDGNITMLSVPVRFASIDNPAEDYIDVLGIGDGIDPGDKGPGKAMSYAVKYALLKCLGLETGDDPDLDQDVQRRSSTAQRAEALVTSIVACNTAEALRDLLSAPASEQIAQSLNNEDPAAWRVMMTEASKRARALGLNIKTGEITPPPTT